MVRFFKGSLYMRKFNITRCVNHTAASDALPVCAGVALGMRSGRVHDRPVYVSFSLCR